MYSKNIQDKGNDSLTNIMVKKYSSFPHSLLYKRHTKWVVVSGTRFYLLTIYSEGAINSTVAVLTSGLLDGSPYCLVVGSKQNSSGTTNNNNHTESKS